MRMLGYVLWYGFAVTCLFVAILKPRGRHLPRHKRALDEVNR